MTVYRCKLCGYVYDPQREGKSWEDLPDDWVCPICTCPKEGFEITGEKPGKEAQQSSGKDEPQSERGNMESGQGKHEPGLAYDPNERIKRETEKRQDQDQHRMDAAVDFRRTAGPLDRHMDDIHQMAATGQIIHAAMDTELPIVSWDDILILGAQLNRKPLEGHEPVNTRTIIGKRAKKPMVLENPVFVSHMSFGALSRETKIALAKGSAMAKTAMCSGEGGVLPEEQDAAYRYIFEYVPNLYSVTKENLESADAIEIKIGQGTKPGMGGHLPGEKVTAEIAEIRNKQQGQDIISPASFPDIRTKKDLKALVERLREESGGRPIGVKIAAGHIEEDLEMIAYAGADFVTIDGRGGATGYSPKSLRDASSVPTIYALYRARKYLLEKYANIDLVITGGLRVSSDFIKALAMGADAVAVGSAPLMAAACRRYKICGSGRCPVGVATQDPALRRRLDVEVAAQRVANYFNVTREELEMFTRITGKNDIHNLSTYDLCTTNSEISDHTNIKHA